MMCADHDEVDDFGIGSEAAKDLLLHFRHSHVLFAEIVGERNAQVEEQGKHVRFEIA